MVGFYGISIFVGYLMPKSFLFQAIIIGGWFIKSSFS